MITQHYSVVQGWCASWLTQDSSASRLSVQMSRFIVHATYLEAYFVAISNMQCQWCLIVHHLSVWKCRHVFQQREPLFSPILGRWKYALYTRHRQDMLCTWVRLCALLLPYGDHNQWQWPVWACQQVLQSESWCCEHGMKGIVDTWNLLCSTDQEETKSTHEDSKRCAKNTYYNETPNIYASIGCRHDVMLHETLEVVHGRPASGAGLRSCTRCCWYAAVLFKLIPLLYFLSFLSLLRLLLLQ